jgi:hypothetical protein
MVKYWVSKWSKNDLMYLEILIDETFKIWPLMEILLSFQKILWTDHVHSFQLRRHIAIHSHKESNLKSNTEYA